MTQSIRVALTSLLAATVLSLVGCESGAQTDWRRIELKDSAGVPLSAIPSVDVVNGSGIVRVVVDSRTTRPDVTANVYADPGLTKPLREDALKGTAFTAEVVEEDGRSVVRVRGNPPEGAAVVEITVHLAACYGVTVQNSRGAVRLEGVNGPIKVQNGVGGTPGGVIYVRTGETMIYPVTLLTTNGDIYFQIPPSSTGKMDLLSLDGEAELRAQGGRLSEVVPTYSWYQGVLNGGTNPVLLRSGKGMVRVTVLDNAATHVPAE